MDEQSMTMAQLLALHEAEVQKLHATLLAAGHALALLRRRDVMSDLLRDAEDSLFQATEALAEYADSFEAKDAHSEAEATAVVG